MAQASAPPIGVFASWSSEDGPLLKPFWAELQAALNTIGEPRVQIWSFDRALMAGDRFHLEVLDAVDRSDAGLFAISTDFLCSSYIHRYEVPAFVGVKPYLPFLARGLPAGANYRGINAERMFTGQGEASLQQVAEKPTERTAFVNGLAERITTTLAEKLAATR